VSTVAALLGEGAAALAEAAIENPRFEAGLLLGAATGRTRVRLASLPTEAVAGSDAERYRTFVARRAAREPMAYVLGRAEFWSLGFAVGPGVLVPRADTETLVEAATRAFPDRARALRVLDLGVGSGCLLLSLLHHFPNAHGIGTDTSPRALAYARLNAERLGVDPRADLVQTGWARGVDGPFDIVVSNPPYVRSGEIDGLQPEVSRFEPRAALDGGPNGLDAYRAILPELPRLLSPDGSAFLEIGRGQDAQAAAMATGSGLSVGLHRDLAGVTRCLELCAVRRPAYGPPPSC
jgi:release factor glutamine methyltransferase